MPDVWLGRFNRWLEKLLNIKGGPTLIDVNPSLQAMIQLASGPEDLPGQQVYRYANFIAVAAVAAQQTVYQLRNPAGSNVICVIELLGIGPSVATQSTYHVSQDQNVTADFPTAVRGFRLDARANPASVCVLSGGNVANADFGHIILLQSGTNAIGMFEVNFGLPLTLLPGDGIRIVDQTVNETFTTELLWRERALESSELT